MLAPAAPPDPVPAPALAPAYGPPMVPPHPWPLPLHLAIPPAPGFPAYLGWPPGGPHPGVPPAGQHPPPALLPLPPTPTLGQRPVFVGKPISTLVCGKNLGFAVHTQSHTCTCAISRAFPGQVHYPFECPIKYHTLRGSCPGWTSAGQRIPTAWAGDDITPACQADWRTFIAQLLTARTAQGRDVSF